MAEEINALAGELLLNHDADKIVASVDLLDVLTDEMETVFSEVLTDKERDVPTDEKAVDMVNKLAGKDDEQ
jgi:hypothetical protein